MNALSRLELWTGRLRIGRAIVALFAAFLCLCLAGLAGVLPSARANDAATLQAAAVSDAQVKTAEAQIETAKALQMLIAKVGSVTAAGGAAASVQQPAPECKGFFGCLGSAVGGVVDTGIRAAAAAGPIVGTIYSHRTAVKGFDVQAAMAHEQTTQVGLREATTQSGQVTAANIATAGYNALSAVAGLPSPPTTAVTVNGNGPVNTGSGSITNASNNPVTTTNPAPVVVGTTGTTVNRGP